ncbi:MAG: tRNA 4-thiouridine(8) synthase ThiI [Deltaproteobacteria bacterium HGW-Deltaproteobacteria-12]|jgi:tRNA U34 2-thiouridine synthase MnmA/TrmU|nr:MAG: tRNA 4-thiouridine(8) synthase ThiI [Deltaproteobacteria bacterium HGW-Deltaproteobacteria-12]
MTKAIALFSGGLDSILAAEVVRRQNIEVLGLTFETPFFTAKKAGEAARQINLQLIVDNFTADHLAMLKSPRYGYGKNMNPCIDCHTLMLKFAGKKMEETGADFIITGEVLGQRPMSQNKQSLFVVARNSGYPDYILRPLSALLLEPIKAEREGKIDRSRLLAISGRGRKPQMQLALDFGISNYAPPAGGCLLTDAIFTRRLRDLFSHAEDRSIRDIELLKYGRHFRINENSKIIVGRNKADNNAMQTLVQENDLVLYMADFPGPQVLVPYGGDEFIVGTAAALCVRYSDAPDDQEARVMCESGSTSTAINTKAAAREDCERWII